MTEIDMVNHPPHYTAGKYETIDIIEDANWGYRLATAFKYLHRCEYKGKKKEDLRKAVWFLLREIDSIPEVETITWKRCIQCNHDALVYDSHGLCFDCKEPESTKASIGDSDNPYMQEVNNDNA